MNKDMMIKLFIFTAGAAIGSAVTWSVLKTKYEQIANEEIESVKQYYKTKEVEEQLAKEIEEGVKNIANKSDEDLEREAKEAYESYAKRYSSGQDERPGQKVEKKEEENVEKPYVISPEEFDEIDEYEAISLTLYADGVLADDQGNIIDDVEETVGKDSLNHFGEYEDDSVFVRNDERRCDYEILADALTYDEAMSI